MVAGKKNILFLTITLLSLHNLFASPLLENIKKQPSATQQQQEAFIQSLNACGVQARLNPLSYEQVCAVCPDLQENLFSSLCNSRKKRFDLRYKAYELIIRNKSSETYLFTPQHHALPYITHNTIKKTLNNKTLAESLLGFTVSIGLFITMNMFLGALSISPIIQLALLPIVLFTSIVMIEYLERKTLFGHYSTIPSIFMAAYIAGLTIFYLCMGFFIFPLAFALVKYRTNILIEILLYVSIPCSFIASTYTGHYIMQSHKERGLIDPLDSTKTIEIEPEQTITHILFLKEETAEPDINIDEYAAYPLYMQY